MVLQRLGKKMTQSTIFWFSFLVSGCIVILRAVNSKEVTVEDGNLTKWFNWNIQIVRSGKNWDPTSDVHSTCGSGVKADFWMITSYFPLNAKFSKVIYVDVEAEFTQCHNHGKDKQVPCYANYFEVYINRGINLPFKEISPNLNNLLTVFSPLYNITSNITVGARTNKTFSFPRNNLQGVELAIRSQGACGSIFRMKMYYYYCEEHFINGVKFEKTASPAEKLVKGHCTGNTIPPNNGTSLFGNCTHNGTWNVDDNVTCTCDRNYALDEGVGICLPLLVLYSKPKFTHIGYGINITWTEPMNIANDESILSSYYVRCFECSSNASVCSSSCMNEIYHPRQENLTQTWVTVSNLTAGDTYVFSVYVKYHFNGKVSEEQRRYPETDILQLASSDGTTQPTKIVNNAATVASNTSNRIIIIAMTVNAGFLLGIVLIVVLVELKREKWCPRLPTPVDIPLETEETSPRSLQLPVYQEPDYEVARVEANDEEHYETISQYETYEEPILSLQNPGYAELDKSQRRNSENNDYQKLQFPDLDYVIP